MKTDKQTVQPPLELTFAVPITGHQGTFVYQATVLRPDPEVAKAAYRLQKSGGEVYHVAVFKHGAECSCPDFIYRGGKPGYKGCKHLRRLRSLKAALEALPAE